MADFAAVLRKTLEGLGDTTPAMRERVYDKARSTIATKLAALNPPPPAAVAERQRQALETAIASVESSFPPTPPAGDPLDELENVFSSINAQRKSPPPLPRTPTAANPPAGTASQRTPVAQPAPKPAAAANKPAAAAAPSRPAPTPPPPVSRRAAPEPVFAEEEPDPFDDGRALDRLTGGQASFPADEDRWSEPEPRRRRRLGGLVAAVLALAVVGGGAYAVWRNGDEFQKLTGITLPGHQAALTSPAQTQTPADAAAQPGTGDQTAAATAPNPQNPAATPPAAASTPPKYTQRLDANGGETDAGAAGGQPSVGEGTSVAELTPPAAQTSPAAPAPATEAPAAQGTATPPAGQAAPPATVPVGQRAIFYEERTSAAPGSAETGSIVWSTVQESPGGDLPPETAIRAEASIPGKDLQLRMTIRRNADRTLPASHIIEMIFLSPNTTGPDAIDSVLRVSMKGTEQDPGSPLLGNAAKIADGYFLLALDDNKGQVAANLALLKQQDWIDIPVVYKSGRRALFTMEKGIPGEKVFNDAVTAWQQNTNG